MYPTIKRLLDIAFSLLLLLALSPLLAIIALAVRLTSPGPVFYRGERVGKGGRAFRMLKFRTMVSNADQIGGPSTASDDARITRVGAVLRRLKFDELPQFINVLKGDMSFVGPRPEVRRYTDMYSEEEKVILSLRPGITDWASIWNSDEGAVLAGHQDPDAAYEELIRPTKLSLQLRYARESSLAVDSKIVFATVAKLVSGSWQPRELADCPRLLGDASANN